MQFSRRSLGSLITAAALVVALAPLAFAASEDTLLSKINAERGSRGLAALESHWDLVDDAEAHSRVMMAANDLHHNPNLGSVTTGWVSLGENVGVGPTVGSIHTAFMNSPPHRANVLGDFTHVGIGAVRESEHRLWITVVFMKSSTATTTTASPTTTTSSPPVTTTTSSPRVPSTPTTTVVPPPTTAAPASPPPSTAARAPNSTGAQPASVSAADRPVTGPGRAYIAPVRLRHQPRPL